MSDFKTEEAIKEVKEMLGAGDTEALARYLEHLHPADIAEVLVELDDDDKGKILGPLDNERTAEVLSLVDERSGQLLLQLLSNREVVSLLEEMPSDDAVDLMATLSPEKTAQIDALLSSDERRRLHDLMEFDEDTAGGLMEVEEVAVRDDATIQDAIRLVRRVADEIENVQTLYVVDAAGRLVGAVPVLNLLLHEPGERISEIMDRNVISVPVDMDQEEVASLFGKYDEFILPVVDPAGKLLGRITVDDIIDVLEEEASEDITRIAGTDEDEIGEKSPLRVSRIRLPWLIVAMMGQVINAITMSRYEASIRELFTTAFFIPLVIGTAGSTGVQAAVIVVREIALGEIAAAHIGARVLRELAATLLSGMVLGVILLTTVIAWQHDPGLAVLLCAALMTVMCTSAFLGTLIPMILKRINIDPAIASGPFITVLSDIVGLLIYMSMVTYYLSSIR